MNANEICEAIEQDCKKYFPNSYVKFRFSDKFLPSIQGRFTLFTEYTSNIIQNDPCFFNFFIYGFGPNGENNNNKMEIDGNAGSFYVVSSDPRYVYDHVKTGFRKKNKATAEQVIKHFDNFFKKLSVLVIEYADRIPTPKNY